MDVDQHGRDLGKVAEPEEFVHQADARQQGGQQRNGCADAETAAPCAWSMSAHSYLRWGAHRAIRALVIAKYGVPAGAAVRILYGGSVKPDNAAALFSMQDVDGGLIGGASRVAGDFIAVVRHAARAAQRKG